MVGVSRVGPNVSHRLPSRKIPVGHYVFTSIFVLGLERIEALVGLGG